MQVATSTSKPRVFVSSTIYDFRDLRSALKFWLEDLGYDIQMSDYADFGKPLDINSYEACFRTIDTCDYFVLLIGSRVGGLYSKPDKISITRAEYRHAYKRFLQQKLILVPFVRRELWDIREDRKGLENYLRNDFQDTKELDSAEIDEIVKHESKFVTDAAAIFSFIDEVARADEMKAAIKAGTGYPKGNWIHVFDTFRDVVAALGQSIGVTTNLRRRSLLANLKHEIKNNLREFLEPNKDTKHLELKNWEYVRSLMVPQLNRDFSGESTIDVPTMNSFCILCLAHTVRQLETTFLDEALRSGEFLDYDRDADAYYVGPMQAMLISLRDAIDSSLDLSRSVSKSDNLLGKYGSRNSSGKVKVKNVDLISPIFMLDAHPRTAAKLIQVYQVLHNGAQPPPPEDEATHPPLIWDVEVRSKPSIAQVTDWLHAR